MSKTKNVAVFISGHGFGHGTRTCAVIQKLNEKVICQFDIFTNIPKWFFLQNLGSEIKYNFHFVKTDIGLLQKDAFSHDLNETLKELEQFLDFKGDDYGYCLRILSEKKFNIIICDISPMGIYLSEKTGIPCALIENFTWDWIYQEYIESHSCFSAIISKLSGIYKSADLRIQTVPFCKKSSTGKEVPPIFRLSRQSSQKIKRNLVGNLDHPMILLTTGGISTTYAFHQKLNESANITFVLSGNYSDFKKKKNIIELPMNSSFNYPDLVNASDLVIGKIGYGTLAECWGFHTPLMGCFRKNFRESFKLREFAETHSLNHEISQENFMSAEWLTDIKNVPIKTNFFPERKSGANQASSAIINLMDG